jgi:hypothetical protein
MEVANGRAHELSPAKTRALKANLHEATGSKPGSQYDFGTNFSIITCEMGADEVANTVWDEDSAELPTRWGWVQVGQQPHGYTRFQNCHGGGADADGERANQQLFVFQEGQAVAAFDFVDGGVVVALVDVKELED